MSDATSETLPEDLKQAIALFYDGDGAPQITAKGLGEEAEAIMNLAQEHDVPLCENPVLIELLAKIELGDRIPEALYISVAHVIAMAQRLKTSSPLNPY